MWVLRGAVVAAILVGTVGCSGGGGIDVKGACPALLTAGDVPAAAAWAGKPLEERDAVCTDRAASVLFSAQGGSGGGLQILHERLAVEPSPEAAKKLFTAEIRQTPLKKDYRERKDVGDLADLGDSVRVFTKKADGTHSYLVFVQRGRVLLTLWVAKNAAAYPDDDLVALAAKALDKAEK